MLHPKKYFYLFLVFILIGINTLLNPSPINAARKTAEDVLVQPIEGIEKVGLFGSSQADIIEAKIMDNYQVYCAAPATEVSAEIGNEYNRYLELYPGETKDHKIETTISGNDDIFGTLVLDDSSDNKEAVFNEGKESYVQVLNNSKTSDVSYLQNIVTADYYKLGPLEWQLNTAEKAKANIITLCSKLNIPLNKCPANINVPNIDQEIGGIKIPNIEEMRDPVSRKKILVSGDAVGAANLPYSKAYVERPAYLVTCVEQIKSGASDIWNTSGLEDLALYKSTSWKNILSSFFGALQHALNLKKDECHVRTIWVPAPVTEDDKYSVEAHNLSRKFLMPMKQQLKEEEDYKNKRGAMIDIAQGEAADGCDADDRINCVHSLNDQTLALIAMINGLAPSCTAKEIRKETIETITSEANFAEGGAIYNATGHTADEDWGLLDSIIAYLASLITTGERTKNDIENRGAVIETFIIAPYDTQITMSQFFEPMEQYDVAKEKSDTILPTHNLFNTGVGPGQEYKLGINTTKSSQTFYDPEKCKWIEGHYKGKGNSQEWVPGHEECNNQYGVGISSAGMELGVPVVPQKIRENYKVMLSLTPYSDPAENNGENLTYKHIEKYSSTTEANNEKLIKGDGSSGSSGSGNNGNGESLACEEYKDRETKLPTMNELMKMVCKIGGNPADSQLLWGILQIEASPMLRKIRAGDKSMSCSEIIVNDCGASGITGQLVPQCIDTTDSSTCPNKEGVKKIAEDTSDPWIQKIRENPKIGCDIETQLKFTLDKRKSEQSWLISDYKIINGSPPTSNQIYYMMAGRNLGVDKDNLFKSSPVCGNSPPVDGCLGANYCVCTMDTFKLDCSNIK